MRFASSSAPRRILGRLFGFRKGNETFYRSIARVVYGVLCFGLLFSVVGTILGGIWANASWGRKWGWDSKGTAALLLVQSEQAIMHARHGGRKPAAGRAVAQNERASTMTARYSGAELQALREAFSGARIGHDKNTFLAFGSAGHG